MFCDPFMGTLVMGAPVGCGFNCSCVPDWQVPSVQQSEQLFFQQFLHPASPRLTATIPTHEITCREPMASPFPPSAGECGNGGAASAPPLPDILSLIDNG